MVIEEAPICQSVEKSPVADPVAGAEVTNVAAEAELRPANIQRVLSVDFMFEKCTDQIRWHLTAPTMQPSTDCKIYSQ